MGEFRYVPYGGGTNSVAQLILMDRLGIIPDVILFADTGAEKPHTYDHINYMQGWCKSKGFPPIVTVHSPNENLEENCLRRKQLPSVAYGFKTCSQRFKGDPQNKYMNNYQPAKDYIKSGAKILRYFGFDADEPQRVKESDKPQYENTFLLLENDWGREECIQAIKDEGIPLPGKSSCYFCPNSKVGEIKALKVQYPKLAAKALELEEISAPNNTMCKGLGRTWAWKDLLATDDMFGYDTIEMIPCDCYDG